MACMILKPDLQDYVYQINILTSCTPHLDQELIWQTTSSRNVKDTASKEFGIPEQGTWTEGSNVS